MERRRSLGPVACLAALTAIATTQVLAGSTTSLLIHQGSGADTDVGDFISSASAPGLHSSGHYFIEVPAGLARLSVDLFDPDIGAGGAGEALAQRDRERTNYNTSAKYTLTNPSGVIQAVLIGDATGPSDNAWNAFFDSRVPSFKAASTAVNAGNTQTLTINAPASTAVGDFLVLTLAKDGNGTGITLPAGWTQADQGTSAGNNCRMAVFYRFAAAAGATAQIVNWNGNARAIASMLVYTGVNTTTPMDVTATNVTGTSATPTAPSITPATANTRIVHLYAADTAAASGTPYPTGNTGRVNLDNNAITSGGADEQITAIAGSGTAAFTISSSQAWRGVTLALRPSGTLPPTAGHWQLDVDMSPDQTTGDDINAFGIRANDGTAGGGGTEVPVYIDSIGSLGTNPPNTGNLSRVYSLFPYITSGCTANQRNFDWDQEQAASQGSIGFTSRTTSYSQTFAEGVLSANDVWATAANGTINRWTSDTNSTDYGIWSMGVTIGSYDNNGQNGNYGNLFLGSYADATTTPTVNPIATAFRIYLPNDAGTAPAEPYVEQWRNYFSGPNPVGTTGASTVFTISIKVTNPAATAITAVNVTANVPGAGVTYVFPSATGSPTAEPGNGGTGNVTWTIASIAAGGSSTVTYRVTVAPGAAGTRRVMTGVPGTPTPGTGTRAQWVDETGNTTQARSTYLFGPLCELAVTVGNSITPVVISKLETRETSDGVAVHWETASEVNAIGFDVYRWEPSTQKWLKINDRLVPALVGSPQGGRYEVLDRGASASTKYWYSIRETESDGKGRAYGPFLAGPASTSGVGATSLEAARPKRPTLALLKASASREATASAGSWTLGRVGAAPALKIGVRNDAVVFLSREEIASHFGMSPAAASLLIATGRFNLTSHGARIAWTPASGARGILFYGQGIDSPYSRDNVYWLRSGAGLIVDSVAAPAPAAVRGGTFVDTIHAEVDTFAATLVSTKPDSDYWYWDGLIAGDPTLGKKTFTLTAPHAVVGGSPSLLVTLASANTNGAANEHHVLVRLNGTPIGETSWAGIKTQQVRLPFGAGLLHDGANTVELEAALGAGVPVSFVYLDSFDLTYSRDFTAANSALKFTSNKARNVTVTGFADAGVMVLDVSNPRVPRRIKNVAVSDADGGFRASFVPSSAQALYVATSETGWQAPAWTEGDQPSSLKTSTGAEYVVVTTADLMDAAERLASLHASTMSTMVVDITDIYDEFADGLVDPRALDAFVKQAAQHWSTPARYVVIAGRGNFDYKNIYGLGGNLVPPVMVSTPKGLFASDTSLGDVNGDGVPEVAVGRIPVLSSDELDAYVDKVRAYETALTPETARQALMLADAPDNGTDFSVASDQIAAGVPSGYEADRIYLQTGADITVPRDELFARLASGADLVNYTGHGALDRLSGQGLLTSDDVPALDNVQTPVLTALSCTINRFEVPGFAPLGEQVVKKAGGGFVASWAPTGLSDHEQATLLGKAFYRDLGVHPNAPLGDAVNRAFKSYMSLGGVTWMPNIYSLIGDPALTLKEGVVAEDPGTGTGTPSTE